MSSTITKTKTKNITTLDDIKHKKPIEYVLNLTKTLKDADEEIKDFKKHYMSIKHKNKVIIEGLLTKIRELEKIREHNENLLRELGTKDEIINNYNDDMENVCNETMKSLKSFKSKDDEV